MDCAAKSVASANVDKAFYCDLIEVTPVVAPAQAMQLLRDPAAEAAETADRA